MWVVCSLYKETSSNTIGGHMVTKKTHEEICWMKSIMSLVKNKQKFKSSKSEYYKLNPKSSPTFSVRPRSSVGRVTVDLIRRSWVRFPPRSKDFFFASCGSLFPFIRANALWVIHGFKQHFNLHFRVNSLFHHLCSQCYAAQHSYVPLLSLRRNSPS